MTAADALGTHARDELGISETTTARPVQAAFTSAATFAAGAALPLFAAALATGGAQIAIVALTALVFLAVLGIVGARAGGAPVAAAAVRVTFWGALAMAVTAAIGSLFGAVV
ncbi:MAG: VIT1/CCC1 transporter family protein [Acidimicrobiales bacterium]